MQDKTNMIISTDVEKVFDKIQHPFIIKTNTTLSKVGIEGNYLNITKAICEKLRVNITLNKSFSSKIRNKARMPIFTISVLHSCKL